jgi:hypothetical protein
MATWLIQKNAQKADFENYKFGLDHRQEIAELIAKSGLREFDADVAIDLASGRGDALVAAVNSGAVRDGARLIAHDHAAAAEEFIRENLDGNVVEFYTNENLPEALEVAAGSRVLILASHFLNQCVDQAGQDLLHAEIAGIASTVMTLCAGATEICLVALEPNWRKEFFTGPGFWHRVLSHLECATHGELFEIENRSKSGGREKRGVVFNIKFVKNLVEIDDKILRASVSELALGFGEIRHEAISVPVFRADEGVSFGFRRTYIEPASFEKILDEFDERADRVRAADRMNLEICGLADVF